MQPGLFCAVCGAPDASTRRAALNGLPRDVAACPACVAAVTARQVGVVRRADGSLSVTDGRAPILTIDRRARKKVEPVEVEILKRALRRSVLEHTDDGCQRYYGAAALPVNPSRTLNARPRRNAWTVGGSACNADASTIKGGEL
jgi:hypothetical protein